MPLVLSALVEISLNTLSAVQDTQSLHIDFVRETGQLAQRAYDHLFFSPFSASTTRFRALSRVCVALTTFLSSVGLSDSAEPYWSRLLLYRMDAGPDPGWEKADAILIDSLQRVRMAPRNLDAFYMIARSLQVEEWDDDGDQLRVRFIQCDLSDNV